MKLKGAEMIIQSLKKEGVDIIFGYPGGAVIPIYDALYNAPLKHILTRHEQGAIHAADGYARTTGRVGVCLATSGPGSTNLVTGIATAYMDSIPLVAITGQVPTQLLGRDAFQEVDITGITQPITKHNYLVKDVEQLPQIFKEAFYIARTGRPGPVLIDIPKDVSLAEAEYSYPDSISMEGYKPTYKGHPKQVKMAAKVINASKRPLIYSGGGTITSHAVEELKELAHLIQAPVTTSLMGLGSFPEEDPLSLGMLGMHGSRCANSTIYECDLLIAVGTRFDDRVTGKIKEFAPDARIMHIDIDPAEICKNVESNLPVVGDVKKVLGKLNALLKPKEESQWLTTVLERKKEYSIESFSFNGEVSPRFIMEEIYRQAGDRAIITTEVGQNQMWAAQYYTYNHPRTFITSGGLGTMGFGLPASMGVQLGNPEKTVINISGDGSFQMCIQELITIKENNLPIKIILLNNSTLGMVRQWQELFCDNRISCSDFQGNPDFVTVAKSFGIDGMRVENSKDIKSALERALNHPGPYLIDFVINREEKVFPIVPPGKSLKDMILHNN